MSLSNFNRSHVAWTKNTEGWKDYKKCRELEEGKHYPFYGCFVTPDNGYGEGGVIISDGFFVNAPKDFVQDIKAIRENPKAVEAINEGKETFRIEKFYAKKYKRDGYRIVLD